MRIFCAMIIAIILALPLKAAVAQDQDVLIVALSSLPPWKMMLESRPAGIDVDILNEAAARMRVGLEFRPADFGTCLKWMKNGQADIMTGLLMTPAREQYLTYVTPPYATQTASAFYALKHRAKGITSYEHLRALRVGVKRGEKHFPQFDIDSALRKSQVASMDDGFKRLTGNRIQTFIANETQADWWLAAHPKTDALVNKAPLKYQGYQPMHFAFSKKSRHADRADQLSKMLVRLIQDGTIDAVLRRYSPRQ
ncbi:substrate-binding periplasmic protein [Desulfovibrio ferrophilus]|uniref:Putative glutamine ABC transporter/glutamine-binding protein n=1 Tax=Desulfovibrio ferrophilus TaxID=241368 RepID=A0A2Z6AZC4_9BACT|nr:transporter substrate-binding domain-containing protein [Desulfovibrio ferrophilus]BBD08568.1 putative glutamine ABC transporter/glutamine-binding protein [Desulfovibrio ferrophilus]